MVEVIYDYEEYAEWEETQRVNNITRYTAEKLNRKHPRTEKLRDFRKSKSPMNTGNWYNKESTWVKKAWEKKTRMKLKQNIYEEAYYNVYARDYKTYGWITW